jgi:predicted dehydrogenase
MFDIKVLIVGCGSIGRRHARNAYKLGAQVSLCDINKDRMNAFSSEVEARECYTDYKLAASVSSVDAVIIATPSNLHVDPAQEFLQHGMHVLMEKPLCSDVESAYELEKLVKKTDLVFMMAHTYRFRKEWVEIKSLLNNDPLGNISSVEFLGGWYLPDWHIHEDYREEYASQKKMGGGVLLTSLSHFFDLVGWLFGDIVKIVGAKMKLSDLEIDVDDAVVCIMKTNRKIAVTIVEDFLSRDPRRTLRINAEHGHMEADFHRGTLKVWDARIKRFQPDETEKQIEGKPYFKILEDGVLYDMAEDISTFSASNNDPYLDEMKYFFELVNSGEDVLGLGIDSGIKVLESLTASEIRDWTV